VKGADARRRRGPRRHGWAGACRSACGRNSGRTCDRSACGGAPRRARPRPARRAGCWPGTAGWLAGGPGGNCAPPTGDRGGTPRSPPAASAVLLAVGLASGLTGMARTFLAGGRSLGASSSASSSNWKAEHLRRLSLSFIAVVVLQIGHMGEHAVQVSQLALNGGVLMGPRNGVFGKLRLRDRPLSSGTTRDLGQPGASAGALSGRGKRLALDRLRRRQPCTRSSTSTFNWLYQTHLGLLHAWRLRGDHGQRRRGRLAASPRPLPTLRLQT